MCLHENLSLETALLPFTQSAANALGLSKSKGALNVDMDADFLLLDEDFNLTHMMAKGKMLMENRELLVKGTFER